MSEHHHPIWTILTIAVVFGGLTSLLYINASEFDATEWKTVFEFAVVLFGWKAFEKRVAK